MSPDERFQARRVAFMFEGTLAPDARASDLFLGSVSPDVSALMELEGEEAYIYVVSSFASTERGMKMLTAFLHDNLVAFDEIWAGFGFPDAELYSDTAKATGDTQVALA